MKTKHYFTGGKKTPGLLFQGEIMRCMRCGATQKSDPKVESGWTALEINGTKIIYICPKCFGNGK